MTVRTLVVDDSVVVRRTVANVLGEADDIEVVATASDGRLGLRRIAELRPDVVTLDVEMPEMDGLETLGEIRKEWPDLPVIMYSTLTERGAAATLEALSLGAVDYATKPSGARNREEVADQVRSNLLPLVRLWGRRRAPAARALGRPAQAHSPALSPASRRIRPAAPAPAAVPSRGAVGAPVALPAANGVVRAVVIGVSTGGPDALATLIPTLPAAFPVPIVIVQHMPPVFTAMLAARLDRESPLTVSEAVDGETARPGHVYIAPGGRHLQMRKGSGGLLLTLNDDAPENSCRPAVDVLFRTATVATSGELLGVVLTGMGQDGLIGSQHIRAAGGSVVVQDEASSVVWGMAGFVARSGLAQNVLPLDELGGAIARMTRLPLTAQLARTSPSPIVSAPHGAPGMNRFGPRTTS